MLGPASTPGDSPITEEGANRYGCAQFEELGFELHGFSPHNPWLCELAQSSGHTNELLS